MRHSLTLTLSLGFTLGSFVSPLVAEAGGLGKPTEVRIFGGGNNGAGKTISKTWTKPDHVRSEDRFYDSVQKTFRGAQAPVYVSVPRGMRTRLWYPKTGVSIQRERNIRGLVDRNLIQIPVEGTLGAMAEVQRKPDGSLVKRVTLQEKNSESSMFVVAELVNGKPRILNVEPAKDSPERAAFVAKAVAAGEKHWPSLSKF